MLTMRELWLDCSLLFVHVFTCLFSQHSLSATVCQALELDTGDLRCDEMISGFLVLRESCQWTSLNK